MKIYKLKNHKYFTTFGAIIHLGTLKKINGVLLEKAEIIEASPKENKVIDSYLTMKAIEYEMEIKKSEEEDIIHSEYYYDENGDLWVR